MAAFPSRPDAALCRLTEPIWFYDIGSFNQEVDVHAMLVGKWLTGYEQSYYEPVLF